MTSESLVTSIVSLHFRRSASLVLGGMYFVAACLMAAPIVSAAPSEEAVDAINDRYSVFGGEGSLLGVPVGEAVDVEGGAEQSYQGGAIYYSKETGAHVMYGAILDRYRALGGPDGSGLGFPTNDEGDTGDAVGRFNDFSTPEGASIYWTPQWGASVIKGRVLDAWRASGGVTGPFGYPTADASIADGLQFGRFVGPGGTEIQWSQAGGLITIPAAVARSIPGFGTDTPTAEGTTSVSEPSRTAPPAPATPTTNSKWWWIPVGIAVLALVAGLLRLLTRRRPQAPAEVAAADTRGVAAPVATTPPPLPARPAPLVRPEAMTNADAPAPRPVAPPPVPPPAKTAPPVTKTPTPAPGIAPLPAPAPTRQPPPAQPSKHPLADPPKPPSAEPPEPLLSEPPRATIRAAADHDLAPVIRYESTPAIETTMQVTYENNALGDDQESPADKSDARPD